MRFLDIAQVDPSTATHCYRRELEGRAEFGFAYLSRNNPQEATEEAADGCIYAYLQHLKDVREGRPEPDFELLEAARHFALAHQAMQRRLARGLDH